MKAVFAGPDDEETCETPSGGCDGAVMGNPYTLDTVPEPGEFDCGGNCRHFIQLSEGAPQELAPYKWSASIGFETDNSVYYTEITPDQDIRPDHLVDSTVVDSAPFWALQDTAGINAAEFGATSLAQGDLTTLIDELQTAGIDEDTLTDLAGYLWQIGVEPEDVAATIGLTDAQLGTLRDAYDSITARSATRDVARELLASGDRDRLRNILDGNPEFQSVLDDLASSGFLPTEATQALTLSSVIDKAAYFDQATNRWRLKESQASPSLREGGSGSGNWDHAGRPGMVGGSAPITGTIKALRKVASIHQHAEHSPNSADTHAAYKALIDQTNQQYRDLIAKGYTFKFGAEDAYRTSQEMTKAVDATKSLSVYNVADDLPADHPLNAESPFDGQTENTIFRAVHDINGHYLPGNTFGERGELKAYQAHAKMYTDAALPALAAETLAQGAWVNHSEGMEDRPVQSRPFAIQKAYAFPLDVAQDVRDGKFRKAYLDAD